MNSPDLLLTDNFMNLYFQVAVEVIKFDTKATVAVEYKQTRTQQELVDAVKAIEHTGGGTSAVSGRQQ